MASAGNTGNHRIAGKLISESSVIQKIIKQRSLLGESGLPDSPQTLASALIYKTGGGGRRENRLDDGIQLFSSVKRPHHPGFVKYRHLVVLSYTCGTLCSS